jgi:two-component system response regulator
VTDFLIVGCGFTGQRVARLLLARGCHVRCTTRSSLNLENPGALCALRDMVTPGVRVLHSVPTLTGEIDRLAVEAFAGAARVVYLSTTAVYGSSEYVDETTTAAPISDRACARLRTERAVLDGPWSPLVLRPAAIYGPGRGVHVSLRIRSEGCVSRIHVDDLAAHVEAALFHDVTDAWPVADDHPCPSREILEFMGRASQVAPPKLTDRRVDGSAIRRILGLTLKYPSYREGISQMSRAPFRVFLAEDNPADVYLVREAFRAHAVNCHLHVIEDGEEAIQYVRQIGSAPDSPNPHLAMVDLNLPRTDPGRILAEFRRNPACKGIPLIVLSSADEEHRLRKIGHLPDGSLYFRKPAELDAFLELGAKVKQILAQAID